MVRLLLIGLWLAWAVCNLPAQNEVSATFEPVNPSIGDTFTLRVLLNSADSKPGDVLFSNWNGFLGKENILRDYAWKRSGRQWLRRFTVIAFDSSSAVLPPLGVRTHLGDTLYSNPVQLAVTPFPGNPDMKDIEDIRGIRTVGPGLLDYWIPLLLSLVVLTGLAYFFRKNRKKRPVPPAQSLPASPAQPLQSPAEKALDQLNLLQKDLPQQPGQVKPFYASLSLILREYLERQFHFPALESTTREIGKQIKETRFPAPLRQPLAQLLADTDMVKYAGATPDQKQHLLSLQKAVELVKSSAPQP